MKLLEQIAVTVLFAASFALCFFGGWKCHEIYIHKVSEIGQRVIKKKIDKHKPDIRVLPFPRTAYPECQ